LIRVMVIALFLIITQFLRAAKTSKTSKPASPMSAGKESQVGEVLRNAMRQAAEQARARRNEPTAYGPSPQFGEPFQQPQFQQPPTIEPESSFIPSFLLLALLACLCLMAYRHWAG
jgi:hypothetical protein